MPEDVAVALVAGIAVLMVGLFTANLPAVCLGVALMVLSPWVTRLFLQTAGVLFGLLLLFQNENIAPGLKLAFVAACAVFSILALRSLLKKSREDENLKRVIRPLLWSVAVSLAVPLWTLLQLPVSGASLDSWLRDGIGYFLLPFAILLGAEAALSIRWGAIWSIAVLVSLVGAISSVATWLALRGSGGAPVTQVGVASALTVFIGLALCLTMFVNGGRHSLLWLAGSLVFVALLASSGGRQSTVFGVVGCVAALLFASGGIARKFRKLILASIAIVPTFLLVIAASENVGGGIAARRFGFFTRLFEDGLSVVSRDGSTVDRTNAYEWTQRIWLDSPLLGRGLGMQFPAVRTGRVEEGFFTLDTPLVVLAKFGVVGAAALVLAIALLFVAVFRARSAASVLEMRRSTFGFTALLMLVATCFNGFPTENRGFPVFVFLLILVSLGAMPVSVHGSDTRGVSSRTAVGAGVHARLRSTKAE